MGSDSYVQERLDLLGREALRQKRQTRREYRPHIFVAVITGPKGEIVGNRPRLQPAMQLLVARGQTVTIVITAVEGQRRDLPRVRSLRPLQGIVRLPQGEVGRLAENARE